VRINTRLLGRRRRAKARVQTIYWPSPFSCPLRARISVGLVVEFRCSAILARTELHLTRTLVASATRSAAVPRVNTPTVWLRAMPRVRIAWHRSVHADVASDARGIRVALSGCVTRIRSGSRTIREGSWFAGPNHRGSSLAEARPRPARAPASTRSGVDTTTARAPHPRLVRDDGRFASSGNRSSSFLPTAFGNAVLASVLGFLFFGLGNYVGARQSNREDDLVALRAEVGIPIGRRCNRGSEQSVNNLLPNTG
jgi:hypothetical protein